MDQRYYILYPSENEHDNGKSTMNEDFFLEHEDITMSSLFSGVCSIDYNTYSQIG